MTADGVQARRAADGGVSSPVATTLEQILESADFEERGERMHRLIAALYPICRSITGDGLRQTLKRVSEQIALELHEVPTGTRVFDWTIPREWNIRDAWVK